MVRLSAGHGVFEYRALGWVSGNAFQPESSKAAVRSFARTWLVELKDRRIHVNVLSPGTIDTAILDPFGPDFKESFKSQVPRGELGRPEEIATVALFLASSDSSFVNGVELFVDGGTGQI